MDPVSSWSREGSPDSSSSPASSLEETRRRMASLAPGDHMAGIYGSDEERQALLSAYVREGLSQGDKILFLAELQAQARHLEEVNTAMQVLLEHREKEKIRVQQDVAANVQKLVVPYLNRMEELNLDGELKTYLGILRSNLQDLTAPLARSLLAQFGLTPTEMRVADLIRHGKSTKEIADLLSVSANAVSVHRHGIRKKLGLLNRKINLRSHLQTYAQ